MCGLLAYCHCGICFKLPKFWVRREKVACLQSLVLRWAWLYDIFNKKYLLVQK